MTPASASCALNLVHVYEIAADYEGAMQVAVDFFQTNLSLGVGVDAAASTRKGAVSSVSLRCRDMLALLNSDPAQDDIADSVQPRFTWVALEETHGYVQFPTPTTAEGESSSALRKVKVMYSNAELDLLALFATVVKVLFLQGRLHLLPGLYRVMEPCRMQSEKSLHETTIRNEMAYLQEIAQLLCYRAAHASYGLSELGTSSSVSQAGLFNLSPLLDVSRSSKPAAKPASSGASSSSSVPSSSSGPRSAWTTTESAPITEVPSVLRAAAQLPIYVLGDSHSVSPAWSVLSVRGEARLLVPRLATGVKHWHLRAESDFYPRAHFQNMVASIPPGSEVILNIGEIDCREGILLAVERDYYATFDEAVQQTLNVFLPVLRDLVAVHKLRVYVHPIPPVLDVTRAIVIRYNAFYKRAVAGLKGVQWLDFFDELVDTVQSADALEAPKVTLKPEFALDGTHLNPSYLRLLETSLKKLDKAAK
eukprot:gene26298-29707_t